MNQPVRRELFFPRSGQQVYIHVPLNVAEKIDAYLLNRKTYNGESLSPSSKTCCSHTGENNLHAQ